MRRPEVPNTKNPAREKGRFKKRAKRVKAVEEEETVEPVYVVEGFLKAKGRGKNRQYLVRWKGYSDDEATWERESKLLKDLPKAELTGLVVAMEL